MLRVTIDLIPGGTGEPRTLGVAHIINDATGDAQTGNYEVVLLKSLEYASKPGVWKSGEVKGFPRKRLGPWDLLCRALNATVGKRNPR